MNLVSDIQPEVSFSDVPEATHDPQAFPPELAYYFQENLPETVSVQGPEIHAASVNGVSQGEKAAAPNTRRRRKWYWIGFPTVMIVLIALGGGIGGALEQRRSRQPSHSPSTLGQPASPIGNTTSTMSSPDTTHLFLANTSIASVSCPNSDRWVFSQDLGGNIRAAQFTNSTWSFASTPYNFTHAKLGTALGASCFEFPTITYRFSVLSPGTYLNIVYFDTSNNLQQSLYNGGNWKNSPVYPASKPPDINTKVSVTGLSNSGFIDHAANGSNTSSPTYSSIAVYQSNRSFVAINLDPDWNHPQDPHVSPDLARNYQYQGSLSYVGESFACIFGGIYPSIYKPVAQRRVDPAHMESTVFGTDISLILLTQNNTATIYLQPNNSIGLQIQNLVSNYSTSPVHRSSWSTPLKSYNRFSTASLGPSLTVLYTYYQASNSTLAEITYDFATDTWTSKSVYIAI